MKFKFHLLLFLPNIISFDKQRSPQEIPALRCACIVLHHAVEVHSVTGPIASSGERVCLLLRQIFLFKCVLFFFL